MKDLKRLKTQIDKLPFEDKQVLAEHIKRTCNIFDGQLSAIKNCRACSSERIVKNGKRKGVQKYICRDCGKHFNFKTNTVLSKIQRLDKWHEFVDDFVSLNIMSLKAMVKKLGISEQTAHSWRHKLISSIVVQTEARFYDEKMELDETLFKLSRKGRRNMDIKDKHSYRKWRSGQTGDSPHNAKVFFAYGRDSRQLDLEMTHTGRTTKKNMEAYFIKSKFKEVTVFSDRHVTYKAFFEENEIKYEMFKSSSVHVSFINKEVHNQYVNAYIRNFKAFTNVHMRGVSTKWLPFYAKWFQHFIYVRNQLSKLSELKFDFTDKMHENLVQDTNGLEMYRQAEISFQKFLKNNGRSNFGDCKHHYYADKIAA